MMWVRAMLLTLLLVAWLPSPAAAQMYRWVDDKGVPHYSQGIDSVPERFRATAEPLRLRNAPAPAPDPATGQASAGPTGSATIRFSPGQRILVDARINGTTNVRLLLDTGADRTVIAPRVVAAAGIPLTRGAVAGTIRGATGTATVDSVMIDSLEVGDARVGRLAVVSHDIGEEGMDGLLGRDFLDQFKVTIDQSQGVATLGPK